MIARESLLKALADELTIILSGASRARRILFLCPQESESLMADAEDAAIRAVALCNEARRP